MTKIASKIGFKAKLFRPAESEKGGSWSFLILPKDASAKLPSRSMTSIEGTINGFPFQATLEPDGQKSHWLKVDRKLREAVGAEAGDVVTLKIAPAAEEPEPESAGVMVGHYAHCAQRLDPLDHLRQAGRDARTPDQQRLLDARRREAPPLLLR